MTLPDLASIRRALQGHEDAALAEVAQSLAATLDRLESLAGRLDRTEWLTPEATRARLGLTEKQWERYSPRLPRRYLSERIVRYPWGEVEAALSAATSPDRSVVTRIGDEKTGENGGGPSEFGGEASLMRALEKG